MARPRKTNGQTNGTSSRKGGKSEGIATYFRPIFNANPKLLKTRSNKELLERWLSDHPGHKEVPNNVKTGLANVKSVLRKAMRKRRGRKAVDSSATGTAVAKSGPNMFLSKRASDNKMENLEMLIDECMTMAKNLDREGLENVIKVLRRARNEVVWKLGGEA